MPDNQSEATTNETMTEIPERTQERWIFGDGEGAEASEYIVHLGKPAFVAEIVDLEDGFDLEFVRWFDPEPSDEDEIEALVQEAAEAIQRHDEEMERLLADEEGDEEGEPS